MTGPAATGLPPSPGSPAALARGCTCPVVDNSHGRGALGNGERFGWWISAGCPLHGESSAGALARRSIDDTVPRP